MSGVNRQRVSITWSFDTGSATYYDVLEDIFDQNELASFVKSHLHEFLPNLHLSVEVQFMSDEPVVREITLNPVKYCTRTIKNIKKELG